MDYLVDYIDREKSAFFNKKLGRKVYKRPASKINLKSITLHSTANENSNAVNERRWLENPNNLRWASYHIVVDDKRCIEVIPLDEKALHCGNSYGNSTSIGIEICESGNREKTIENAIKIIVDLLYTYNLDVEEIYMHRDWDKSQTCPRIINDKEFFEIKKEIKIRYLNIPSKWSEIAWKWAIKKQICDGQRPKEYATREEVIAMLSRLQEKYE